MDSFSFCIDLTDRKNAALSRLRALVAVLCDRCELEQEGISSLSVGDALELCLLMRDLVDESMEVSAGLWQRMRALYEEESTS